MGSKPDGYFEAWANSIAWKKAREDNVLINTISRIVQQELRGQVHLAGSQRKGTSILGSDIDLCVSTKEPVTLKQRTDLAARLTTELGRTARPGAHIIRVEPPSGGPHIDIAFANAAFGSRPLPNREQFYGAVRRQHAARALKWWLRERHLPHVGGWAVEAVVVRLDQNVSTGAELFLRILEWLVGSANTQAVESMLRPAAFPKWHPRWSNVVPGRLEAIRNAARRLQKQPREWRSVGDVENWLRK